jgi:ABC-type sugar transport system substrate-binding protein
LLRNIPGGHSTEQRERGFLETLAKEFPEIQVISSDQYAGTAPEAALNKATDVLNKYADRVTRICAVCESNAAGQLGALENTRLSGKVNAVVFDPNSTLIKGLAEDKLQQVTNSARPRATTWTAFISVSEIDEFCSDMDPMQMNAAPLRLPQGCSGSLQRRRFHDLAALG